MFCVISFQKFKTKKSDKGTLKMRVWSGTQASSGDTWAEEGAQEIELHRPGRVHSGPELFYCQPSSHRLAFTNGINTEGSGTRLLEFPG